jgi:hypothetical protein
MPDGDFVSDIIKEQEITRNDIRSLKEIIERQGGKIDDVLELLQTIVQFQEAVDKREARQIEITADVARIANSAVLLAEDTHRQAGLLTGIMEKLNTRLSAEATLDYALDRMRKET